MSDEKNITFVFQIVVWILGTILVVDPAIAPVILFWYGFAEAAVDQLKQLPGIHWRLE